MYFGIAMIVPAAFDRTRISASFGTLSKAHPFLNAVLGCKESENRYFYDVKDPSGIRLIFGDGDKEC